MAKIEGKRNVEMVRKWGRTEGETVFNNVYKAFITKAEPCIALEKFKNFHRLIYNFDEFIIEDLSDTDANIVNKSIDLDFEVYYKIFTGWLESFLELSTDKKITIKL